MRLKIAVSVVRFRPWAPFLSMTYRMIVSVRYRVRHVTLDKLDNSGSLRVLGSVHRCQVIVVSGEGAIRRRPSIAPALVDHARRIARMAESRLPRFAIQTKV